jgi:hypothetical protein
MMAMAMTISRTDGDLLWTWILCMEKTLPAFGWEPSEWVNTTLGKVGAIMPVD